MLQSNRKLLLNEAQREGMRRAGRFNAELMDYIRPYIKPGLTTEEIDRLVYDYTIRQGHTPATLGYLGYKKSCCTSVNEVICHGIPNSYALKEGDIVNVDITSVVDGWHGDQSETFLVGECSEDAKAITQAAFDCLYLAIGNLHPVAQSAISVTPSWPKLIGAASQSFASTSGTAWGVGFISTPTSPTFPIGSRSKRTPPRIVLYRRADDQRRLAFYEARQPRQLDRSHPRRQALGSVRTHGFDDRAWTRDSYSYKSRSPGGLQVLAEPENPDFPVAFATLMLRFVINRER